MFRHNGVQEGNTFFFLKKKKKFCPGQPGIFFKVVFSTNVEYAIYLVGALSSSMRGFVWLAGK